METEKRPSYKEVLKHRTVFRALKLSSIVAGSKRGKISNYCTARENKELVSSAGNTGCHNKQEDRGGAKCGKIIKWIPSAGKHGVEVIKCEKRWS